MNLAFGPKDIHNIRSRFLVREVYFRICFTFYVVNEYALLAQERPVVLARNRYSFVNIILILQRTIKYDSTTVTNTYLWVYKLHDRLLEALQIHGIFRRSTSDDVILIVRISA